MKIKKGNAGSHVVVRCKTQSAAERSENELDNVDGSDDELVEVEGREEI